MNPPNPKSIALSIGMGLLAVFLCYGLLGCEKIKPGSTLPGFKTGEEVDKYIRSQGALPAAEVKDLLYKEYYKGVIDQVVSQAQAKPIYVAEYSEEKKGLVVYKPLVPVEIYPDKGDQVAAKAAESLDKETRKPLQKK